jgi:hypothetical protein
MTSGEFFLKYGFILKQCNERRKNLPFWYVYVISSQIGPKSNRLQSNRPQVKSAPSQIGLKIKVISAQKNKNKKRINK